MREKILSAIMGFCVADAVGVPHKSKTRNELKVKPVYDMEGFGTFNKPPGTWSDESSLTLCFMDSLARGLNYNDIMVRFLSWYEKGNYTPDGEVFDIGNTTKSAIEKFAAGEAPLKCGRNDFFNNAGGALKRILPLCFYIYALYGENFTENEKAMKIIHNISSLTHAHNIRHIACGIYISIACKLLSGKGLLYSIETGIGNAENYYEKNSKYKDYLNQFERIFKFKFKTDDYEIISNDGFAVSTLELSLFCLYNSKSYKDCVLKAVNLGNYTDTVAAISGGLAALFYGYDKIPENWISALIKEDYINDLTQEFSKAINVYCVHHLLSYIPLFERIARKSELSLWCSKYQAYMPVNDDFRIFDKINDFIDSFYNSGAPVDDYLGVIKKYNIEEQDVYELNDEILKYDDLLLLRAFLTWHFKRDRFCEGSLISYSIANGKILLLLKKIGQIIDNIGL